MGYVPIHKYELFANTSADLTSELRHIKWKTKLNVCRVKVKTRTEHQNIRSSASWTQTRAKLPLPLSVSMNLTSLRHPVSRIMQYLSLKLRFISLSGVFKVHLCCTHTRISSLLRARLCGYTAFLFAVDEYWAASPLAPENAMYTCVQMCAQAPCSQLICVYTQKETPGEGNACPPRVLALRIPTTEEPGRL